MSKKLENLLKSLGIVNVQETIEQLNSEEDTPNLIPDILKSAQTYARPFVETELKDGFNTERKSLKGKYLKEALTKANKLFGTPLSNKEIEEVLNDPENEGQTFDKGIELLKEKVTTKTGASETELQKMLDTANAKLSDYEKQIPELETKYKTEAEKTIAQFKLDGVVSKKLVEILAGKTSMNASKAAELIRGKISEKAALKLREDGNIALFKLGTEDEPLKKNDTTLYSFDALVDDLVKEYELPEKKSEGTQRKGGADPKDPPPPSRTAPVSGGLANAMANVTLP